MSKNFVKCFMYLYFMILCLYLYMLVGKHARSCKDFISQ